MNQPQGLFITGTDTGVGKTLVSAILAVALQQRLAQGFSYLKPMESGIYDRESFLHDSDGARVKKAADLPAPLSRIIPFHFREPLAPLLAARRQNKIINRETLLHAVSSHLKRHAFTLVEGAGGLMVPLCPGYLGEEFIHDLQLPALVVCRSALGGVNHTLMTLRCLRQAGVPVAGLVVNHLTGRPGVAERHFIEQVAEFDPAPVIAELPHLPGINYTREELLPLCERLHLERLAG